MGNGKNEKFTSLQVWQDKVLSGVILLLVAAIAFMAGLIYQQGETAKATEDAEDVFPTVILHKAFEYLTGRYVEPLEDYHRDILYGAIRGMVQVVQRPPFNDPYSGFYDPGDFRSLEAETTGSYAGVGIIIEVDPGMLNPRVIKVFRNSPAAEAGIRKDDYILEVGDSSTSGMSLSEIGQRILGEEGTVVKISVADPVTHSTREIEVVRAVVTIHSVEEARMVAPGIGYIKLATFSVNSTSEMVDALEELSALGLEGLILDLRGNGGGMLAAAVALASMFLPADEVVATLVYRKKEPELKKSGGRLKKYDVPVVVLVDGYSASASEVLASALRDHGKAVLVGDKTFGKGKVQEIIELSNRDDHLAMVLTVAKYYTPGGRDIDGDGGLVPDIQIGYEEYKEAIPRLSEIEAELEALRESILGYRSEAIDRIAGEDIVLARVSRDFDGVVREGFLSRESALEEENAGDSNGAGTESAVGDDSSQEMPEGTAEDERGEEGAARREISRLQIKC